ncbi:hypothetical protein [Pseudobacteroides cellulosolvens]|uniref:Uncharacterized protein n=1 Tax=Pseudobacteroides cellulosolvens ATCC 35603 = DSM 2933 TaxID=398512 RepID=A0A0L6JW21_9FIRM|nr:hypothetical protein [Pseudobacteroides cellulosolvens]KNY29924.1 hypothetical protein Bccel_5201 [Pseudobacteroides cellulosolvens ATCC 35603 = DSM 2933]
MYDIELDYSENSVEKVEQLCEIIHQQIISNQNTKVITIHLKSFECYPIGKVYKRLKNGDEGNIEFYYKVCKNQILQQK